MHRSTRPNPIARLYGAALLALLLGLLLASTTAPVALGAPARPASSSVPSAAAYVNISATDYSFSAGSFNVVPGQAVHLIVTQLSTTLHTFTLSSVANTTVTPGFFATHSPLVNLSLGTTVGSKHYANFTAPAVGYYEYICIYHSGSMYGKMYSATSSSGSGYGGGSTMNLPPLDLAIAGAAAVVVIAVIVTVLMIRRKTREEELLAARPRSKQRR